MAGKSNLPPAQAILNKCELDYFLCALKFYDEAVKIKSSSSTKKNKLVKLDQWYQDELPAALLKRGKNVHFLQEELVKLMDWKLTRGKFRPRLLDLAASNSEELVKNCTAEGIKLATVDISRALKKITRLSGVGPATASAVLAAAAPQHCAFFADEVAYAALGVNKGLKYNEAEYMEMNESVAACADRLNKLQSCGEQWTPHSVELALWSYSVLRDARPQLFESPSTGKRQAKQDQGRPNKKKRLT